MAGESAEHSYRLTFRPKGDSWLIYGDQQPAAAQVQAEALSQSFPPCAAARTDCGLVGPSRQVTLGFRAPKGVVLSASVTGGGLFASAPVVKMNYTEALDYHGTGATGLRVEMESFYISTAPAQFPPPGTPFTISYALASGKTATGVVRTAGTTTEGVAVLFPTGHALADAQLGRPLSFTWTLPRSFSAREINLKGQALTAPPPGGSTGFQCQASGALDPGKTSGTIALPKDCRGRKIVEASVTVGVHGPGGESSTLIYTFR
jgi:hypothetical protein